MANFTRTQPDGTWITGYQVLPSDLEDLDRKVYHGLKKTGGVHAPTTPIAVDGFGLALTTALQIRATGSLRLMTGATLTLGDGDYQDLEPNHVGRTRKIYQAMAPVQAVGENGFALTNVMPSGAVQPVACSLRRSTGITSPEFVKKLRVHHGAKLARLRLRFSVPTLHSSQPQRVPRMRVFRVRTSDGIVEDLKSGSPDGFFLIAEPKSGGQWTAGGAVQEYVFTTDQNNVIDDASYAYYAHIQEEVAGINEAPLSVKVYEQAISTASTAANLLNGTCDGIAQASGRLCIFKNEVSPYNNGVFVSPGGAGAWTRVGDLNTTSQFQNGMLFPIPGVTNRGNANPGTCWQLLVSRDFVLGSSPVVFRKPVAAGTIFLGVLTEFENILTTRFQ